MSGGGKDAHIAAGFGEEHFSDDSGESRDAHQQVPGRLKRFHRLLDALIKAGDVGGVGVDAVQKQSRHERVVVSADPRPADTVVQVIGEERRPIPVIAPRNGEIGFVHF